METYGQITSVGGNLFLWNLEDITISYRNEFGAWSPPFTYSGGKYGIRLWKTKKSYSIQATLSRHDHNTLPRVSFEFQLRTGDESVSPSYAVTPDVGKHWYVSCVVGMLGYLRERENSVRFPRLTFSLRMDDARTHPERRFASCAIQTEVLDLSSHDTQEKKFVSRAIQTEVLGLSSRDIKITRAEGPVGAHGDFNEEEDSEYENLKKLQDILNELFLNEEEADVTLKVQDEEFPAHRKILRSRSSVFKAMFGHNVEKKLSDAVVIEDCDSEIFPDFLNHLYTGNTEHVNEGNVCQLYTVCNKYHVAGLKTACVQFMKSHLSVDSFCDFFTLILKHSEAELIDRATKFFCANVEEIIKTEKWEIFLRENATVGNALFLKAVSQEKAVVSQHIC